MISLFCLAICNAGYSAATSFGLAARNRRSLSPPLSFSSSSHFLSFSKPNFRVGDPQSPFSISSSFILFFVSLPFFLKTKLLATLNRLSLSLPLSFSSSSHFLAFSKPNFRVGDPQSPFSISSSFILFFVSLPFFLKTKVSGWRPSIAFSISSSFILFFVSLPFFLKTKFNFEHATRCQIRVGQVALVVWRGSEEPHVER